MLDLSADNRDGFEDTDGQLYTSNSLLFFIREICMLYYERLIFQLGEYIGIDEVRVRVPLSLLILFAKITRPLMRKNSNIIFGGIVMKNKLQKFMDDPLTIRRELKMNAIVFGIFAIPCAAAVIIGLYKTNKAIAEMDDKQEARLKEMMGK